MPMQRGVNLANRKIWLLKLVLPIYCGRWLTGILLLSLLLPFFYLGVLEEPEHSTPALFFALIIAYIIPVFSYITARSQEALIELRPILDLDDQAFQKALVLLDSASPRQTWQFLCAGALAGFVHMSFVRGSVEGVLNDLLTSVSGFMSTLGALLVWVIMTTVISMLIQQSVLFGRLGAHNTRVSLLNTRTLLPFARVSISSSLAIIGALALFPLIGIESGQNMVESLPGAIATLVPMVIMFVIPVWPVHRCLAAKKEQELAAINSQIETCLNGEGTVALESAKLEQLTPLLNYRREISQVSSWPFDMGNMTRFAIYLIIPPLTWAGAAMIENLVDSLV
ncbi:MAG: hypothetical protein V7746_22085 [Halioglobus sp.]